MSELTFPLSDLRVLELTAGSPGAMVCGRMLAELGADVRIVEPPDGHAMRVRDAEFGSAGADTFPIFARGKKSAVIDFAKAGDRAAFATLAADADVLIVDGTAYEQLDRAGLKGTIAALPSLIVCVVTPYGLKGSFADVPGCELTVQALAGVLATNGDKSEAPISAGVPVGAFGAALYALIAILAALFERARTGQGQLIDQSEFDALISFQGTLVSKYLLTGEKFIRVGNRHTMTAPWNNYRAAHGWVSISTVGDHQWRAIADAMGRPELGDDKRFALNVDRVRNVEDLDALISEWTASLPADRLLGLLDKKSVPASRVSTLSEALADAHARERMIVEADGTVVPRLPFRIENVPAGAPGRVPALGDAATVWAKERFPIGSGPATSGGPLKGVKAVDIGILTAGPLAGRILAMLGADVVKVEPPQGERTRKVTEQIAGTSYLFHMNNTDKSGITFDETSPADRDAMKKLIASSDIFISNIGDGSLGTMGLSIEALREWSPSLICTSISAYGRTGPMRGRKGFDMVIQAQTGVMAMTGRPDGLPTKVALSIVDLMSALSGAAGTIVALIARLRYGQGVVIDASLFDAGLWLTQTEWSRALSNEGVRLGNRARYHAPYGCFETADGWLALGIVDDAQWASWLKIAGFKPEAFAGLDRERDRVRAVEQLEGLVAAWARSGSAQALCRQCTDAGIPAAPVLALTEAIEHKVVNDREMLRWVSSPSAGRIRVIGAPIKMSRSTVCVRRAGPELGEGNSRLKTSTVDLIVQAGQKP